MKLRILCVGKCREKYLRDAISEYVKRLSAFAKVEITEVPDEKIPEHASVPAEEKIKNTEGERLLRYLERKSYVICLDLKGRELSSEALAEKLRGLRVQGESDYTYIIGGSLGLSQAVLSKADFRLCFSPMTFPHQLMRVILLDQLYRAEKIIAGEPYHK